jgi:hypothetical protein
MIVAGGTTRGLSSQTPEACCSHLMASVPYFRLPKLHALLRPRGTVTQPPTYLQVLKREHGISQV